MVALNELLKSADFQLNAVLWLLQPMPSGVFTPVLHRAGFQVYAIEPQLSLPPDLALALRSSGLPHQQSTRPDVVACRASDRRFVAIECKGGWFGPVSTTAGQARTLLVVCGERLSESLGLATTEVGLGAAGFLTADEHVGSMRPTVTALTAELRGAGLEPGSTLLLGLKPGPSAVFLTADAAAREFFGLAGSEAEFIALEPDTDPRPLYLLPDPGCGHTAEGRAYCRRVLCERILSEVLGAAGRALPPQDLVFAVDDLLRRVTFGVYDEWENTASRKDVKRLVRELLTKLAGTANAAVTGAFSYEEGWRLHLATVEVQSQVCRALALFKCETIDLGTPRAPGLFDGFVR